MADPTDFSTSRVVIELGGGAVVALANRDDGLMVLSELPPARAHMLAHVLDDWSRAFGLVPDDAQVPSDVTLARGLEWVTAAAQEASALPVRLASRAARHG